MKILKKIFLLISLTSLCSTFVACETILKINTPVRNDVVLIHEMSHYMADYLIQINKNWALAEERHEDYKNLEAALEALQSSPTLDIKAVKTAIKKSQEVENEYNPKITLSLEKRKEIEAELFEDYMELGAISYNICVLYCRVVDRIVNEKDCVLQGFMTAQALTTSHILLLVPDVYEALENPVVYGIIERSGNKDGEMGESTQNMIESLKEIDAEVSIATDEIR